MSWKIGEKSLSVLIFTQPFIWTGIRWGGMDRWRVEERKKMDVWSKKKTRTAKNFFACCQVTGFMERILPFGFVVWWPITDSLGPWQYIWVLAENTKHQTPRHRPGSKTDWIFVIPTNLTTESPVLYNPLSLDYILVGILSGIRFYTPRFTFFRNTHMHAYPFYFYNLSFSIADCFSICYVICIKDFGWGDPHGILVTLIKYLYKTKCVWW